MDIQVKSITAEELEARVKKAIQFVYKSRKVRHAFFQTFSGMDHLDLLLVWWADKHGTLMYQGTLANRLESRWLSKMQQIDPAAKYSKKYCQYQMAKQGVLFLHKARHELENIKGYTRNLLNISNCAIFETKNGLAIEDYSPLVQKVSLFLNKDGSLSSEYGTTCSTVCVFNDDSTTQVELKQFVEWNRKVYSKSLMTYALDYAEYLDHSTIYGLDQNSVDLKRFLSLYTDDTTLDTLLTLYGNDIDKVVSTAISGTQPITEVALPSLEF